MNQLKVETVGNRSYLSYTVAEQETLDSLILGMLGNNSIAGLIPLRTMQFNKLHILRYEITDLHSLEAEIDSLSDGRKLLLLLKSVADSVLKAQEYMIDDSYFIFDLKHIYVDSEDQSCLVCLPVKRDPDNSLKKFCVSLMDHPKVIEILSDKTLSAIKKYLSHDLFQLQEFSNFLSNIEIKSAIVKPVKAADGTQSRGAAIVLGKSERISSTDAASESEVSKKPVLLSRNNLRDLPPSNKTVYLTDTPTSALYDNDDETVSLADRKIVCAYLVRKKTQEKIEICRDEFLIGKSRNNNDYCIPDNPAVSRNHAKIIRDRNNFFVIDTNSKNHVYINHKRIEKNSKIQLTDKDHLRLANEDFVFTLEVKVEI